MEGQVRPTEETDTGSNTDEAKLKTTKRGAQTTRGRSSKSTIT